jgi:hypothetical protein
MKLRGICKELSEMLWRRWRKVRGLSPGQLAVNIYPLLAALLAALT